ncbi:hypothetical protein JH06_1381 [Blastocystis sp. subtype 4]|uniref:hypothetical protein n=1 Tax=Blastocystis sp. subtype 4 TaxID=944170 RepID=UPI000711A374|nr:hypothetical protein JH06_1381 [Blastocystis sp. subtype 4]KNB45336.1 hypothetical protein JH06_1381 [Blastocystis sp. subtype 4]|eukprot:XP_014528779.1 hypothetical protein JH06_1381 [Blastocystis sp. subtype 4]
MCSTIIFSNAKGMTLGKRHLLVNCPGAYEGYIGRFCTPEGDWGLIKDLCYLPDGRNVDEYEVEL